MKMTNRQMVDTLKALTELKERVNKRTDNELTPKVMLTVARDIRLLTAEYRDHYVPELNELKDKYLDASHTVAKEGISVDEANEAFAALLDLEIEVGISTITLDDVPELHHMEDAVALDRILE